VSYLELTPEDLNAAQNEIDKPQMRLGQWVLPVHSYTYVISALRQLPLMMYLEAVVPVLVGREIIVVFYCFGTILPVSGAYSILSLAISGLLLIIFRPILREIVSAVPFNGGNYSYLLNFASKTFAVVAAAITLLDAVTTVTPAPINPS
jgi:amino acid transporter